MKHVRKGAPFLLPLAILLAAFYFLAPISSEPSSVTEIDALAPVEIVADGFKEPTGVAVDSSGALFVSDRKAGEVLKITGSDVAPFVTDLKRPVGLAFDGQGRLLIVEEHSGRLLRREAAGSLTVSAAGMKKPRWIALAEDGTIYLTAKGLKSAKDKDDKDDDEEQGEVILRFTPNDSMLTIFAEGFKGLQGIVVHQGNVFAAAKELKKDKEDQGGIFKIPVLTGGAAGEIARLTKDKIKKPFGLVVDTLGALYVSAEEIELEKKHKDAIGKVAPDGTLTRFASKFEEPRGLAFDSSGNLYVADDNGDKKGRIIRFRAPPSPLLTVSPFTNQNPLTLTGTSETNARINAFLNDSGSPMLLQTKDGGFSLTLNLAPNVQNSLDVFTTAQGGNGLTSAPAEFNITHDNIAPLITNLEPANGSFLNNPRPFIRADFLDSLSGVDVGKVEIRLDGFDVTAQASVTSSGFTLNFLNCLNVLNCPLSEGPHTVSVTVFDRAGNSAPASTAFTVDITAPLIANLTPAHGSVVSTATPLISAQFQDNFGINLTSVRILLDGVDRTAQASVGAAGFTLDLLNCLNPLNCLNLFPGLHTVSVSLSDLAGNSASALSTFTVSLGPQLAPVGDKLVNLGETLTFTVSATGAGGPASLFVSPLPLPNRATFNAATGEFRFTPDTSQVGSFQLTFSAVSGSQTVSETITITVPQPPPGGITSLRGKVENLNDTPLGNVKVTLKATGHTAFSTDDGFFTLTGVPSGRQELIINGRAANLGVFAILAVPVDLIEGVLNNLPSAITLPDVDVTAEVPVSQTETTVVANPHVPGVALTIPAATAKNSDGTPYIGKLSINPVPDYGRPESRPEELRPGMAITIQPAGVRFNPPAPLTFPNGDGMVPGSELNLWSLSPDTGTFNLVGKGVVTQDGLSIVTTEGGVSASAWHFFLAPSGNSNTDVPEGPGLSEHPDKQCIKPASSTVALQNGCLGVEFTLPSYRSLGSSRSLKFVYKTNRANPQPVIPFNATIPVRAAVPPKLSYSLSVGGVEQGNETFINTSGLNENQDETIRAVASFDASQLKTGVYPYRIKLTSNYLNSAISSFISDKVLVVNEQKSTFGAGWGIEGLGRLHFNADGSVVVTDGNGSALTFKREVLGQVSWWPGDGDANDIAGINHGTLQGGVTFAAGKIGKAFSFDGVDDFVQVEHNPNLDPGAGSFTIAAWVKTNSTGSQVVVSKYECGQFCPAFVANSAYFLQTGGGRFAIFLRDTDGGGPPETSEFQGLTGTRTIADSNFHHVAMVRDIASQQLRLYVDGAPDASASLNAGATGVLKDDDGEPDPFLIGASIIGGQTTRTSFFSGLIDDVQFYNRALSASEIQTIFTSPSQPLLAGNFTTPAGDFSTLVKNNDDTFTRALKDGTKINFNAQGLQTSVVDRNGNTTSYSYDGSGRLVSITDPAGLITTFSYAGSILSAVTDSAGRTTSFTTDAAGNLIKVALPDGSFKSFGYDSEHLMTSETDERGFTVQRQYDSVGRLATAILPDGTMRRATSAQSVGFADPATGLGTITNPAPVIRPASALSTFTDGSGNTQIVKIGKFGAPQQITDALGQTTAIERNTGNNGTLQGSATFSSGQVGQAFSFDGVDDHVRVADSPSLNISGQLTISLWMFPRAAGSAGGDLTTVWKGHIGDAGDQSYGIIWLDTRLIHFRIGGVSGLDGLSSAQPLALNQWTHVAGTYNGSVLKIYINGVLSAQKSTTITTLTDTLQPLLIGASFLGGASTGAPFKFFNGLIDEVAIYDRALTVSEIQAAFTAGSIGNRPAPPSGLVSWWQGEGNAADNAGGHGLPTRIVRPNGAVVTMNYDTKGNLFSSTDPVGATTTFSYEPNFNQVTSIQDPKGNATTITYDAKGNPTQIRDAQGNLTQMVYDARGLLTSVTSAVGKLEQNTTSFTYDARGNLLTTTDPLGRATNLQYDPAGNVVKSTDSEGRATEFTYDFLNRLVSVIDSQNQVTRYAYDGKGNLIEVMDANAQTTSFSYNTLNRLSSSANPLGLAETFAYDANGNLISTTNRKAETISFEYDVLNRLIRKTLPGNQMTTFAYDSVGNLTSVVDPDSAVSMAYDLASRLISTTASTPSMPAKTISHSYDLNGHRLTMTDPQGGTTGYAYDSLNRLTSLTNPAGKTTTFTYDALGHRTSMTHGNGVVTTYGYDAASQLLSLVHQLGATTINSFSYSYDGVGNRKSRADKNGTASYTYDTLNRLVQATNPLPLSPESYVYDAVGNRVDSNQNGASNFNGANQLLGDANFTYQYDANGNQSRKTNKTTGELTQFEYDAENKLVRAQINGTVANYRYDGLGRRVEKEVVQGPVANVTRVIYDNEDILLELDGSNNVTARYTHGPGIDEPLIMEKGGQSFFYHADGLGSITEITNQSGTVVQSYTYSSFGKIESQLDLNFVQPYAFTAREFDSETGLHFYRNRTLDPLAGRFVQEDPYEGSQFRPQTLNRYPYVSNNPVRKLDPFGLQEETAGTCPPRKNCLREYFKCLSKCVVAPDISIPTLVSEAGPAAEYFYTAEAWAHAASKNLIYPNKSSIFRPIMRNARVAGATFALVALNYCIYVECLVDELKCENLF